MLVDRHLVRAERLLANGDADAALEAMNEVLALQKEHDLVLPDAFDFEYAQVAYAAGRTETAIASANQYLVAAGREGEFYREALELLDSADVRLEQEAAQRRRAEAERRRAEADRQRVDRWPPGHVFRDCERCPEMVVLPGSAVTLGRYEVTVGEYQTFASATNGGPASPCLNLYGERVSDPDDSWDHSWRDPGFPQTYRHPVTCMTWDDAQAYVSWLRRTTEACTVCQLWTSYAGRRRVLRLGATNGVRTLPATTRPVPSAPTAATDWGCRTCSRTYPSGPPAASRATAGFVGHTAHAGSTWVTSLPAPAATHAPTIGALGMVSALRER